MLADSADEAVCVHACVTLMDIGRVCRLVLPRLPSSGQNVCSEPDSHLYRRLDDAAARNGRASLCSGLPWRIVLLLA
jgi:hypothetical protein